MRYLILIFIILIFCNKIFSQTTITGKISDKETGTGLGKATVYITDIQKGVLSDANGNFRISDVPEGILKIHFSMIGFFPEEMNIRTDTLNSPLDIKLKQTEIYIEEIRVEDNVSVKPYPVEKITSRELMRYSAMNISEAVTKVPGVWQLSTGTGVSKPVIRGLYGNRIGIMVNGIRFDNQQWQDEHGLVMSSDGIDNIEIIKGPESLMYGPEAIGGVVSITNEHPAPVGKEIADLNLKFFTNTLGILGNAGFKGAQNNFNWLFRFGGESHADYLDGNSDRIPETRFGGYNFKAGAGYLKGLWSGQFNYDFTSYTYGILEAREFDKEISKDETRFDRSFNGPHHLLRVHNFVFRNIFIKDRSKVKINLGFINNNRKEQEGNDERFLPDSLQFGNLDMTLKTSSADARWIYSLNRFTELNFGTQGFLQTNVNSGQRRLIPDANVASGSLAAIINYKRKTFTFDGGLRYDHFSVDTKEYGVKDSIGYFPSINPSYNSINGSGGVVFKPAPFLLVKANLSSGFRAPNLAELTSNGLHEGVFQYEIGNPDFKSEQGIESDVAANFENKFLSVEVSAYLNNINDYIYLAQTADTIQGYPVFRYYQSDALLKGIEADLKIYPLDWLSFRTNYSTVIGNLSDGSNLPLIPADKITADLHFELSNWKFFYNPYFDISTYTSFAKTRLAENETSVPAYTLLNAGLGCDLKFESQLISMTLTCNNMLNKVYIDFMSRIKLISAEYNGKIFTANNMGRNIVLSLKIPFKLSYN